MMYFALGGTFLSLKEVQLVNFAILTFYASTPHMTFSRLENASGPKRLIKQTESEIKAGKSCRHWLCRHHTFIRIRAAKEKSDNMFLQLQFNATVMKSLAP